ncbi:MAG: spore maturation protein [Firmicutes bacterium]|nr:spore maturation protein [Bacillota bacterium]
MNLIENLGSFVVPLIISIILIFSVKQKISIFSSFISGTKEGINCILSIFPSLIALVTSVTMLKASGALQLISNLFDPIVSLIGLPSACIPLVLMKPISGSASNALLHSILKSYGAEGRIGRMASIITGSTDATLYVISTYCVAVGTTANNALIFGLISDLVSLICSILIN